MLKVIAANQAKGNGTTPPIVEMMQLEETELPEKERLQDIVTYDVVPEIESYMHAIDKRLHSSLDDFEDTLGQFGKPKPESNQDEEEDKSADDEDDGVERGRQKKRAS